MAEWAEFNWGELAQHQLICTGTTGRIVEAALQVAMKTQQGPKAHPYHQTAFRAVGRGPAAGRRSSPRGKIDVLIFFGTPCSSAARRRHQGALRLAVLYNIPTASNRSTADFIISSPLYSKDYKRAVTDYSSYLNRKV